MNLASVNKLVNFLFKHFSRFYWILNVRVARYFYLIAINQVTPHLPLELLLGLSNNNLSWFLFYQKNLKSIFEFSVFKE